MENTETLKVKNSLADITVVLKWKEDNNVFAKIYFNGIEATKAEALNWSMEIDMTILSFLYKKPELIYNF